MGDSNLCYCEKPQTFEEYNILRSYVGTKIIKAKRMSSLEFMKDQEREVPDGFIDKPGYQVHYPPFLMGEEMYISWSPQEVFEACYRELMVSEKDML